MVLSITISPTMEAMGLNVESLLEGIAFATKIIQTDKYAQVLLDNIDDSTKPSLEEVKRIIGESNILIKTIEIGEHMDAYALVYRITSPYCIFFNPLLILNIKMQQFENVNWSADVRRMYSLFLGVKVVHEFSHIIHPKISKQLQISVLKRSIGGKEKRIIKTPEKTKDSARFHDFGEMIEFDIFGGIVELFTAEKQPKAFQGTHLVLYAHPSAREGHLITIPSDLSAASDETLDSMKLRTEADDIQVDKPYKGPRGHLPVHGTLSMPYTGNTDVIVDGDSEEEDGEGMLIPTY